MDLITFFREFGVPMGLVVIFTIQGWRREKRLAAKIDVLDTFARETLLALVTNTSRALNDNTDVMQRITRRLDADVETQSTLMELIKDSSQTIAANTAALQRMGATP